MPSTPDISHVAGLLSDPSRSAMLISLLDGRPQTATELAQRAKITPQTASLHLSKLVSGHLISKEVQGKYHYFRLTDPNVAHAIESLIAISPPSKIYSLREADEDNALRKARTCYDHLAGRLGINLAESIVRKGYIDISNENYRVTDDGKKFFSDFGIDFVKLKRRRRKFIHPCLDWSERTPHIGGALGAALLDRITELGWIDKKASQRAVRVTELGKEGFRNHFELSVD